MTAQRRAALKLPHYATALDLARALAALRRELRYLHIELNAAHRMPLAQQFTTAERETLRTELQSIERNFATMFTTIREVIDRTTEEAH